MEFLRQNQGHDNDLPSIFEYIEADKHFSYVDSVKDLVNMFPADQVSQNQVDRYLTGELQKEMKQFEWLYGQTPDFSVFMGLDEILNTEQCRMELDVHRACIRGLKFAGNYCDATIQQTLDNLLIDCRYSSSAIQQLISKTNDDKVKSILHKLKDDYIII